MFAGVLLYVFWPGMKDRLERDQRKALDLEVNEKGAGGRS
jgi:hypothetical protein